MKLRMDLVPPKSTQDTAEGRAGQIFDEEKTVKINFRAFDESVFILDLCTPRIRFPTI